MPKSPMLIYANQMLLVPTTLLPEMTQEDLSSSQHDLALVKKLLVAVVYSRFRFKYHMHTNCCGTYILRMPSE